MDFRDFYDGTRYYHHNAETVTLTRPSSLSAGAETSAVVMYAHSRPSTQEEVDSPMGGSLDGSHRTFHLWAVECGGLVPKKGYRVTRADGTSWRAEKVETLAHGRRFRLHTILTVATSP